MSTESRTVSTSLELVCTSLSDFFAQFERYVGQLDRPLEIALGSLGEANCQVLLKEADLTECKKYLDYKHQALNGAAALLTSVSITMQRHTLQFLLSDWKKCWLPVEFDEKRFNRSLLTKLADSFELRSQVLSESDSDRPLAGDRDVAYLHAMQHFEQSAAIVNESSLEASAAVREFLSQSSKQLSQLRLEYSKTLAAERAERKRLYEEYLRDADQFDVREHALVRRRLLEDLNSLTDQSLASPYSEETIKAGLAIAFYCRLGLVFGVALASFGIFATPAIQRFLPPVSDAAGFGFSLHPLVATWLPVVLLSVGVGILLVSAGILLRQLHRVQKRNETLDESLNGFKRDLLRMSWLSELYMEAVDKQRVGEDAETALPPTLVERFSRSLFTGGNQSSELDEDEDQALAELRNHHRESIAP